jgi:diguanylate cyclase (GGDEF)-like protein
MSLMAPPQLESLLAGIDQGVQAHLAWNQRLMRCALLHESPGADVLAPDAHQRCIFGKWFLTVKPTLSGFDAAATDALAQQHHAMHEAVRALCIASVEGVPARSDDLQAYEDGQNGMVASLGKLRQKVADALLQHDALTGLPLRNGLEYAFRIRQRDAARSGQPLHLAMIDVDHFKVVNDSWGHGVGDLALQHLARLMSDRLRGSDILVRYGGEEFLFLLLGDGAQGVIERLLQEIRTHPLLLEDGTQVRMTVTAGMTPATSFDTLSSAVDRADRALMQGKQSGRDRCVAAPAPGACA